MTPEQALQQVEEAKRRLYHELHDKLRVVDAFIEFERIHRKHKAAGMRGNGSAGRS